jgi:hypothetical protein
MHTRLCAVMGYGHRHREDGQCGKALRHKHILGRVAHGHGGRWTPSVLLARGVNIADSALFYTARFKTEESASASIYNSFCCY